MVLCLSQDGACTDSFENFLDNSLKGGLSNDITLNPLFTHWLIPLKGHGNEADFLGFLHKSVRHRSFTVHFEPFRFWLRIRGDIRNRKTTRMPIVTSLFKPLNKSMVLVHYIPGLFFANLVL